MEIKSRWWHLLVFVALIFLASELRSFTTPRLTLPQSAAGWKMEAVQECVKGALPAKFQLWRGTAGARQICRAEYGGSPEMTLTLYDMPGWSGATAFDALQKWQSRSDKMAFYKGDIFGVVEAPNAGPGKLHEFIAAVETSLPRGPDAQW